MFAVNLLLQDETFSTYEGLSVVEISKITHIPLKLEIQKLEIQKDVVDPEDIDMLSDLVIAAVNEAIRKAQTDKSQTMDKISDGLNVPGLF